MKLTSRTFDHDHQLQFARASGDHNDVHIDPISARRSIVGRQVVHGVHLVLWAIDGFLSTSPGGVERITASFRKPVFIDEKVDLHANNDGEHTARLAVSTQGTKLLDVILRLGQGRSNPRRPFLLIVFPPTVRAQHLRDGRNERNVVGSPG